MKLAVPDSLKRLVEQISEKVGVLAGERGEPLDRAVRVRDLTSTGLLQFKRSPLGGSGGILVPPPADTDLSVPPQPVSLNTYGMFGGIMLSWDFAAYGNHDRTEIWRAEADLLGNALMIGTSQGKIYMDYVGDNDQYYYWVRLVSSSGVAGPYNATSGVPGQTTTDPAYVIQTLGNTYATQQLLDALGTQLRGSYTGADISGVTSGLLYQESQFRQIQYDDLAAQISILSVGVPANFDTIKIWHFDTSVDGWQNYNNAVVSYAGGSLVVDAVGADPSIHLTANLSPGLSGAAYQLVRARIKRLGGAGWIGRLRWQTAGHAFSGSYEQTTPNPSLSIGDSVNVEWDMSGSADWKASAILNLQVQLGDTSADDFEIEWIGVGRNAPGASVASVTEERLARIGADDSLAASLSLVQATANDAYAAVGVESVARVNADNSLFAQYTVKVDTNGYISGFGLASTAPVNGTPSSSFVVRADVFKVVYPGYPQVQPFTVASVNGVSTVGIQGQLLVDGSITATKIAARTISADRIATNSLTANEIQTNSIAAYHIRSAVIDGTKINAAQFSITNGGASIDMTNARVQFTAGGYTRVTGVNFGASANYVDYFGPAAPVSSLADANAKYWLKNNGDAFFGGTIRSAYQVKAWARFYGTTTAYFTRQFNFAAVSKITTGRYQFTFATPMPNRYYVVLTTATRHNDVDNPLFGAPYDVQLTGFKMAYKRASSDFTDTMLGGIMVFGSDEIETEPPPGYDFEFDPSPPSYGGQIP